MDDDSAVLVSGIRYKPYGVAVEAFRYALDAPMFAGRTDDTAVWVRERLATFVESMPPWLATDTLAGCDTLATLIRRTHGLEPVVTQP